MENADEFDSECSEYVTFTPSVRQLDERGMERRSATEPCIQVHYFRSVAAAARPDRAPDTSLHFIEGAMCMTTETILSINTSAAINDHLTIT
ncbi:unnamed protein product [Danaus chrysippus]|uniref:(African queen) hypothetical protein n=1 Tax=Danaus chrysippus TaxID=151541 RepID=A0A8J2QDL7_9NEOP|nr:unnamed protein product [Danaus chrysippus]